MFNLKRGSGKMSSRRLGTHGAALIKYFEGCRLTAYKCPADKWTIGYGHTGKDVKPNLKITPQKAEELFQKDITQFEKDVNSLIKVELTQNQFDALVSFAYNTGSDIDEDTKAEGLGDSTLLKLVNAGRFREAALEFSKWVHSGGKVLPGLVTRRQAEQRLFNTKDGAAYAVH